MNNQLVLRLRGAHLVDNNFFILFAALMVAVCFLSLPALVGISYDELRGFYSSLDAESLGSLTPIVSMLAAILIGSYFLRVTVRGQIVIDDVTISYQSRLPEFLKFIRPDWRCPWNEVKGAALQPGATSQVLAQQLVIAALNGTHTLLPWHWVEQDKQPSIWKMQLPQGEEAVAAFQETPILVLMREKSLLKDSVEKVSIKDDLDSDPRVITIAVIFVLLIMYFMFDQYFGLDEFYASTPPYHWMIGLGAFVAVLAHKLLPEGKELAARVRLISILLGIGVALATYPFFLRINASTDEFGLQAYEYELIERGRWQAANSGELPDLIFDIGSPYWNQFNVGDRKEYELRQGGLGFAQVNMAPLYAEQRAFYESQ
jgi:hypothetical protein